MNYRKDKYGNPLSILGFGCMRLPGKLGHIDMQAAEGDLAFHTDPKPLTRRLLCGVQQEPLHWHGHFCGRGAGFCAALSLVRPCEAVRRACNLRAA